MKARVFYLLLSTLFLTTVQAVADEDVAAWEEEDLVSEDGGEVEENKEIKIEEIEEIEESEIEDMATAVETPIEQITNTPATIQDSAPSAQNEQTSVGQTFPELSYENMDIQPASMAEVEAKGHRVGKQRREKEKINVKEKNVAEQRQKTHKVTINYFGQKALSENLPKSATVLQDQDQLISGSAPLFQ